MKVNWKEWGINYKTIICTELVETAKEALF